MIEFCEFDANAVLYGSFSLANDIDNCEDDDVDEIIEDSYELIVEN